ncbi:MAG: ABC transporter permease subunit [Chloroflexota bacterium]|nr:ABC transporter permease subunit [Chloroflexota bacterium]MDE2949036.1 ABC transporter permease subunit [Chloroflexota bacterium]
MESPEKVNAQLPDLATAGVDDDAIEYLSRGKLIRRRFWRHRLARLGLPVLLALYMMAIFADFIAPYPAHTRLKGFKDAPPSVIHFGLDGNPFRPYVYARKRSFHPETFREIYTEQEDEKFPIHFFVRGERYEILGLFKLDLHLFGVDEGANITLFGTDSVSRDLFSRTVIAARVSLFVGLGGVAISFVLGCLIGGVSGYLGGIVDEVIQRIIDLLIAIPTLPLWMVLSAAIPREWPVEHTFFAITIVLSIVGWTGLARVVRGKLLSLRDLDFVVASKLCGGSDLYIITRHLLPNFASHLIVTLTLAIPGMILGETALSFIGIGMLEPGVSWGVLLQDTMNFGALVHQPWKLIPGVFIIVTILMFNFVGDGLRDAADPYSL